MTASVLFANADYQAWLKPIKQRISAARIGIALAANRELIRFYWDLGGAIAAKQAESQWGDKVMPQLSHGKFMSDPQKGIFDSTRKFVQSQEPNFAYVESEVPTLIHSVLNDPSCFKGNRIQQIKSQLDALAQQIDKQVDESDSNTPVQESKPQYISSRNINVSFDKAWLTDENDVERYLETLRIALLEEIHNGKRIQI